MSLNDPILPGPGSTDYERYLRTDELLSLQRTSSEWRHRDELLFQTIHQTSELWLKLASEEFATATSRIGDDDVVGAIRLMRRAVDALDIVNQNTRQLAHISPWDYRSVRQSLGHGSGFDSPGFRKTHELSPKLGIAFTELLQRRGVTLLALYQDTAAHEDLFLIAERLLDWDERLIFWRGLHLKMVERIIGGHVIGTQGTPVEVLAKRIDVRYFPALWDVRNELTIT